MANVVIDILTQFKGKPAFKDAEKSVTTLEGSVKNLGKAFATVFAAQKVIDFSKDAVKAFMEDQKSAALLTNTIKNLGLQFANTDIESFIKQLERTAGVVDEKLRPAMSKLLQTTGSVLDSQKLLKDAISISRGSGVDLETVVTDITNAYVGNNKGLKKYALGLTQAELKVASFDTVMAQFNRNFSGANEAYLSTYTGKMELLNTAADNAKETIGKGLVDALAKLSGGTTVQDAADNLQLIADSIAAITGAVASFVGLGVKAYKFVDFLTSLGGITGTGGKMAKWGDEMSAKEAQRLAILKHTGRSSSPAGSWKRSEEARAKADEAKRRKEEILRAQQKAARDKAAAEKLAKQQQLLAKQSALFDIQQIELVAALKGELSEQDRKRAELQLALLQGNEEAAAKLSTQIANSIDKTGSLAKYLQTLPDANNPFKSWDAYLTAIEERIKRINQNVPSGTTPPTTNAGTGVMGGTSGIDYGGHVIGSAVPNFTPPVVVQFSGTGSLVEALRDSFVSASMEGSFSQINRSVGAFDR